MAAVLLVLFPLLLLVHTRAAWVALGLAIVLLCSKALAPTQRISKSAPRVEHDASI